MFFKKKPKPPITIALTSINEIRELLYNYKRDKSYKPTEADLNPFEEIEKECRSLQSVSKYSDTEAFMLALRYLTEAKGGVNKLSEATRLNRQNLYKVLTGKTAPKLATAFSIMKGLGYHFKAEPRSI